MSQLPRWLMDLKRTLPEWIDRMSHPDGPGRYRFAVDAFAPYDLDSSHMFHNIVFTTGGGKRGLPDTRQQKQWIEYLLDLQREEDGWMIDTGMERCLQCAGAQPTDAELLSLRRWTTRNGLLTVTEMGGKPRFRMAHAEMFRSPAKLIAHLDHLDWSLPWSAGSHAGAAILFQHFNRLLGDDDSEELIKAAVNWLIKKQDPATGSWSDGGDVSLHQRINGIMKIWNQVLPITDMPIQYPERVIDLCIRGIHEDPLIAEKIEACSVFDVALVLDTALRVTNHRREEIVELAHSFLPRFEVMLAPDGAFSYFPGRSLDSHSGLLLGPVKHQSDAVGTSMHCHAIALLANLGGFRNELRWIPLTEWRMNLSMRRCVD